MNIDKLIQDLIEGALDNNKNATVQLHTEGQEIKLASSAYDEGFAAALETYAIKEAFLGGIIGQAASQLGGLGAQKLVGGVGGKTLTGAASHLLPMAANMAGSSLTSRMLPKSFNQ